MRVCRYESTTAWSEAIVALWCERLTANPRLRMCLPVGRTPQRIYAGIAQAVAARRTSFANTEIFLLDEYGELAADDPGRCANMLRRQLLARIDLPPRRFIALDAGAADLDAMCAAVERRIGRRGFELTLLGIGTNGHVGMNEPGSDPASASRRVDLHPSTLQATRHYLNHDNIPTWGVTIGLHALLRSQEIWLLASGASKAAIVHSVVAGPRDVAVPASLFVDHPNCRLFVDATAAAAL
jgi:glucosamine-6-phosphate deaminase